MYEVSIAYLLFLKLLCVGIWDLFLKHSQKYINLLCLNWIYFSCFSAGHLTRTPMALYTWYCLRYLMEH